MPQERSLPQRAHHDHGHSELLGEWEQLVRRADDAEGRVRIALVGKYVQLADAYKSVIEALGHGGFHHGVDVRVDLVDSEALDEAALEDADGILILPAVFGAFFSILVWLSIVIYHEGARVVGTVWMVAGITLYVIYRRGQGKSLTRRFTIPAEALQESAAAVSADPLPTVQASETQLILLFQNLIGNAVKFAAADRPVQVHVSALRRGDDWLFSVRDNGIGIEPQYLKKIFELGERLHSRRHYPGTGFGLAICEKIVEGHGGKIWAESQPGQGSTFCFTLPAV